ncbi:MAG: hypothetical protein AABO41_27845 [Acidobacteriota bacterium]
MERHRIETTLKQDGILIIEGLPFHAGETVEVIILPSGAPRERSAYPLRGTPVKFAEPFEPVAAEDWEAAK